VSCVSWQRLAVIREGEEMHQVAMSCKRMEGMGRLEGAAVSCKKEKESAGGEGLP
jgi:hypothetical protein